MKKNILFIIVFSILINLSVINVKADDEEKLEKLINSNEYEEVLMLQDEILEQLDGLPGIQTKINAEDLRYDKAIKLYADNGILDASNTTELKEQLENTVYCWVIPIYVENTTLQVNISKMKPRSEEELAMLDDESRAYILSITDVWSIDSIGLYDDNDMILDYEKNLIDSIEHAGIADEKISYILINGIPRIQYPAFVGFNESEIKYLFPAEPATAEVFKEKNERVNNIELDPNNTVYKVYNFKNVKDEIGNKLRLDVGNEAVELEVGDLSGLGEINSESDRNSVIRTYFLPILATIVVLGGITVVAFIALKKYRKNQ